MNKLIESKMFKYILFTICFWAMIGPLIYKISNIGLAAFGGWDAITQIYQVMLYTSRVLKEFFGALFGEGNFTFPMVEWSLGMGDDVISALNWHGLGDPFYLLTVFVQEKNLPYFFTFLFYFRVYLGGIAFIAFAYELDSARSSYAYAIGALIYSFTGFTVQCNMHLIFVHAMMYIPLLLLGAERTIQKKTKGVLCITTFLFALSGFFYLYIGSISLAVYVIYRMLRRLMEQGSSKWKQVIGTISEMLAEYVVGIGLAAVIFVPAVLGFLGSNRASVKINVPLTMSWTDIKAFWINLFLPQYNNYQVLSICTIGVMCILVMILERKRRVEKINLFLLTVCAFIPTFSVIMSGFGECYDRWEVVITLYMAYVVVEIWDELGELSWLQRIGVTVVFLLLGIFGKKQDILEHERYGITMYSYGICLFVILVLLPICKKMNKQMLGCLILFLVAVITIGKGWKGAARDREIAYVQERDVISELINDNANDFYRIDNERTWSEPRNGQNIALTLGYHGISEYISIENPSFTNALVEWNVSPDAFLNHMNVGLDTRGVLETLCSVKYLIKREDVKSTVPYGFYKVRVTEDGLWSLYKNEYALPLMYSYDKVFHEEKYQDMHGFEKQQVMLQAAAVEGYQGEMEEVREIENALDVLEYSIESIEGGRLEKDSIQIEAGGKITLKTKFETSGENYLLFEGVDFDNNITVTIPDVMSKGLVLTSVYHNGNIGVNLGVMDEDVEKKIELTFQNPENFELKQMKILHYDFASYDNCINNLREESLRELVVDTNSVQCVVDLNRKKMLCAAVPYSGGWTAYIDGNKTETYRVNDMFVGIEVPEGEHDIVLKYVTPGIKTGIAISTLSVVIIVVYLGFMRKKQMK